MPDPSCSAYRPSSLFVASPFFPLNKNDTTHHPAGQGQGADDDPYGREASLESDPVVWDEEEDDYDEDYDEDEDFYGSDEDGYGGEAGEADGWDEPDDGYEGLGKSLFLSLSLYISISVSLSPPLPPLCSPCSSLN